MIPSIHRLCEAEAVNSAGLIQGLQRQALARLQSEANGKLNFNKEAESIKDGSRRKKGQLCE